MKIQCYTKFRLIYQQALPEILVLPWIYFINFLVSLMETIYFFEKNSFKTNNIQCLFSIFSLVLSYGYAMSTFSTTLEGVMAGNQIYYAGVVMVTLALHYMVAHLCGVKLHFIYRIFWILYAGAVIFLNATVSYLKIFYKTCSLGHFFKASYIIYEPGPLHFLLNLYLSGLILFSIVFVVYTLITRHKVSKITMFSLLALLLIFISGDMVAHIFNFPLQTTPYTCTIAAFILNHIYMRMKMYDMSSNVMNVYERRNEYGYITFDLKHHFTGCNDYAQNFYPSLEKVQIDSSKYDKSSRFYAEIITWIESWNRNETEEKIVKYKGKTAACSIKFIKNKNRTAGYLVELKDISKQQDSINYLDDFNKRLQSEVLEKTIKIQEISDSIIEGMASMVESRDNSTGGHIKRTSAGVKIFIDELKKDNKFHNLSENFCINVIKAAPMHDLGKIAVDDVILRKPGKYTPEEYAIMKKHPAEGAKIVRRVLENVDDMEFRQIAENVAHYHHEKWDGSGYPEGLKGEQIPLEARIMALADVFDALVSRRCYKEAFDFEKAYQIVRDSRGTHFDPELEQVFEKCFPALKSWYEKNNL